MSSNGGGDRRKEQQEEKTKGVAVSGVLACMHHTQMTITSN